MFTTVSLQLPTPTLLRPIEQLKRRGGTQDLSEAISTAVESWLAAQQQKTNAAADTSEAGNQRGYQWKCLFLPEGTLLRSWSYGEHNYAAGRRAIGGAARRHTGRRLELARTPAWRYRLEDVAFD